MKGKQTINSGISRWDVVITIGICSLLALSFLFIARRTHHATTLTECYYNLHLMYQQINTYNLEHGGYVTDVPAANGGTKEYRDDASSAYRHFAAIIKGKGTTFYAEPLICPKDIRKPGIRNHDIGNTNISYFISLEYSETKHMMILAGNRNIVGTSEVITPLKAGIIKGWNANVGLHQSEGNILRVDGSKAFLTSEQLLDELTITNNIGNCIIIP